MKQTSIFILLIVSIATAFGQNSSDQYAFHTKKADSFYRVKEYRSAALAYSDAFKSLGWKGSQVHRYGAARSWALAGVPDSAFYQLERIATMLNYADYGQITTDSALTSLHQDKRWEPLLTIIKSHKEKADKAEAMLNKPLIARLDSIFKEDQECRKQLDTIAKKYGWESSQTKAQMNLINNTDSINLIKVKAILDKYGWLGSDVIGSNGNLTLFLIIQHSDLSTQEKYLPMMRGSKEWQSI